MVFSSLCFTGGDFCFIRPSRSLRACQISDPIPSYFTGSVSFIICATSRSSRAVESARLSDMEHLPCWVRLRATYEVWRPTECHRRANREVTELGDSHVVLLRIV